jgi:hypothetical protein
MKRAPDNAHGTAPDAARGEVPTSEHAGEHDRRLDQRKRELITGLIGRKVSVSTHDLHHVVGRLITLDGDDRLRILVNNQEVHVRRLGVARIHEADPALAEYLK